MKQDLVSVSIMLASLVLEVRTGSRGAGAWNREPPTFTDGFKSHWQSIGSLQVKAGWLRGEKAESWRTELSTHKRVIRG